VKPGFGRHSAPARARDWRSIGLVTGIIATTVVVGVATVVPRLDAHRASASVGVGSRSPGAYPSWSPASLGPTPTPTTDPSADPSSAVAPPQTQTVPDASRGLQQTQARVERIARRTALQTQGFGVTVATLNVLASQHTTRGGDHPGWPSASWRTPREAAALAAHGVDVVGLQEVKPDQLDGLMASTGFKAFPGYEFGSQETDNSVLYDPSRFDFVSGSQFSIVFMSRPRPQTILRLRDKQTQREFYVVNMHTSAGHDRGHTATRYAGMAKAVDVINGLKSEGLPVFVTGDMNDRAPFRSRVLTPSGMSAAIDGAWRARNFGSGWMAVDWIASAGDVTWSDYWVEDLQSQRVSDHYLISAHATVAATDG
jgi:endonuclease/exonuclease/phosphatase family metal-dependent hydrolase